MVDNGRGDPAQHNTDKGFLLMGNGELLNLQDPAGTNWNIHWIVTGLIRTFRFSGQLKEPYNVAQHSVLVMLELPEDEPELRLAGLLHDAAEGPLTDVPSPVKWEVPQFRHLEEDVQADIYRFFGVSPAVAADPRIKQADGAVYQREVRDLHPHPDHPIWRGAAQEATGQTIRVWNDTLSYEVFMLHFDNLTQLIG